MFGYLSFSADPNYTSIIFKSVGANLDKQLFETVAIGIVNVFYPIGNVAG
jgi:hypothetical protein